MQTVSVDRLVGQKLGNYRVERLMGQGRLSAVYFAQNTLTGINGALTLFIVPEHFSQDACTRFIQRFRKEATALTALQHQHVLPVHEYGEYQGYPYLVTPYMTNGSLADSVKRQGRCNYTDALDILDQVVAGLEYAHRRGVIHGTLKPSNIVLGDDQNMLVAGFGLMHMLQMRGVEPDNRPYGHLLSIADTFLAAPEYIAPEIVQGQSIDKRSDIYALGIILFELLSGKPPFTGQKPLDIAKMHVEQSIPSLRMLYPDIPMAVISVVNQALDRDPTRRFQSAGELAEAFAQAVAGATGTGSLRRSDQQSSTSFQKNSVQETPRQGYSVSNWQLMPPIVTGKITALNIPERQSDSIPVPSIENEDTWQFLPPVVSGNLETLDPPMNTQAPAKTNSTSSRNRQQEPSSYMTPPIKARVPAPPTFVPPPYEPPVQRMAAPMAPSEPVQPVLRESRPEEKKQEWWEQAPQNPLVLSGSEANQWGEAPMWAQPASSQRSRSTNKRRSRNTPTRNTSMGRRKVVAMLAAGGVVAAGVLVGVKFELSSHAATTTATTQPTGKTTATTGVNKTIKPTATKTNGTTPTKQPQTPHTGTIIGSSAMAPNSSVVFNNNQDLLIRLANGNFVAYNRACTHQGVPINYDPASQHMICPLHGATFDPAQNAKVLLGPATTPVAAVKVKVNSDGTITMV